jgi:biotin carboxylase
MVLFARERGLAPVAISSAANDGGTEWFAMCDRLGVPAAMSSARAIRMEEIDALLAREQGDYAFAFAIWDGQRSLMAHLNRRLGANDLPPEIIDAVQDKYLFRQTLVRNGLSALRVMPATSPEACALVASGTPLIVKPRRGLGSLMTGRVDSPAALDRLNRLFEEGVPEEDLFSEFTRGNELIAETFFEGTEFSFEILRNRGRTAFWAVHEKTRMEYSDATVLERGFTAPCVTIGQQDAEVGYAIADRALGLLGLDTGSFHVEMLRNGQGEWEFIEINTRQGGALITDSVHAQYGRHLMGDWMDLLLGRELQPSAGPSCGVYVQCGFAFGDRRIARILRSPDMQEPDLVRTLVKVGMTATSKREDIATLCLWKTERARHAEQVGRLAVADYFTLEYEE